MKQMQIVPDEILKREAFKFNLGVHPMSFILYENEIIFNSGEKSKVEYDMYVDCLLFDVSHSGTTCELACLFNNEILIRNFESLKIRAGLQLDRIIKELESIDTVVWNFDENVFAPVMDYLLNTFGDLLDQLGISVKSDCDNHNGQMICSVKGRPQMGANYNSLNLYGIGEINFKRYTLK